MRPILCSKEDIKAAACYFQSYMSLGNQLLKGNIDSEEFEDYMLYRGRKMSRKATIIAEIMAQGIAEEMRSYEQDKTDPQKQADIMKYFIDKYGDL